MLKVNATGSTNKTALREPGGLTGWIFAWMRTGNLKRSSAQKEMNLLETLPLGGRRQLILIECSGERFLVGCGAENIHAITPISTTAKNSREEQH